MASEKRWNVEIQPVGSKVRQKLTVEQQIEYMRDEKGIEFGIVTEKQAKDFLKNHSYYFKVKAFEKNYSVWSAGENEGKYVDLEFAYLQELSTLDMYLRTIVLSMALDIEHYLKVQLLKDISEDENEDGYCLVESFLKKYPRVGKDIQEKSRNSYCKELIDKYNGNFAVWNIVEVLSFGHLLDLCELYYSRFSKTTIRIGDYRIVKFLRNAAAHNNCLINNLRDNTGVSFSQNRRANSFISKMPGISPKVQNKKMGNRFVHDFVVMLCCFNEIVSSPKVKYNQMRKLKELIDGRFTEHSDYFANNAVLQTNYQFIKKVVDKFAELSVY